MQWVCWCLHSWLGVSSIKADIIYTGWKRMMMMRVSKERLRDG